MSHYHMKTSTEKSLGRDVFLILSAGGVVEARINGDPDLAAKVLGLYNAPKPDTKEFGRTEFVDMLSRALPETCWLRDFSVTFWDGESDWSKGADSAAEVLRIAGGVLAQFPESKYQVSHDVSDGSITLRAAARDLDPVPGTLEQALSPADRKIGAWLSASLDDPNACEAFKEDIRAWFDERPGAVFEPEKSDG